MTMTKEKAHDADPAIISDHAYEPRGEWWSLCKHCGLAEAAHSETTINSREYMAPRIGYYSDDNLDD